MSRPKKKLLEKSSIVDSNNAPPSWEDIALQIAVLGEVELIPPELRQKLKRQHARLVEINREKK